MGQLGRQVVVLAVAVSAACAAADYNTAIRPLWEKYCFGCHLTGVKIGSFELGTYEELMRPGPNGFVVIPGDSGGSRLYQMIAGQTDPAMPMDGRMMAPQEVEVVRRWIEQGASGPNEIRAAAARAELVALASPDSRFIRIAGAAGLTRKVLTGPAGAIALALSPDGTRLATLHASGRLLQWDLETGTVLGSHVLSEAANAIRYSGDGSSLEFRALDKSWKAIR